MKVRWLWVFLGLSLALNVAFIGGFIYARFLAPPPPPSYAVGTGPRPALTQSFAEIARELELDDAQRRRLRQTFMETRRAAEPRVRELLQLREKLVAEYRKPQPDQATVDQTLDRIALARAEIQKEALRLTSQFAATLPPDKQERLRLHIVARLLQSGGPAPRQRRDGAGPQMREDRPARQ